MLEERGFSTVAIASVRPQAEKTRPPRALWTTSQLGRPLGESGDTPFQRRVLMAALGLLERTDGPVILDDFSEDPPGWRDTPAWRAPPLVQVTGPLETPDAWAAAFRAVALCTAVTVADRAGAIRTHDCRFELSGTGGLA